MKRSWRCGPHVFRSALDEFRQVGGKAQGSDSEGTLRAETPLGRLEGLYTFDGDLLTITITRRPAMLPAEMIWSRLDAICGQPVASA